MELGSRPPAATRPPGHRGGKGDWKGPIPRPVCDGPQLGYSETLIPTASTFLPKKTKIVSIITDEYFEVRRYCLHGDRKSTVPGKFSQMVGHSDPGQQHFSNRTKCVRDPGLL
jgi:hypothetical protein